jgi:PAS domain S-box-containing protein
LAQERAAPVASAPDAADEDLDGDSPDNNTGGTGAADPLDLPADLRTVLEAISAGVTVQDASGRLIFVNEDAARLGGFSSPEEMRSASPGDLVARFRLIDEDGRPFSHERLPGRRVLLGGPEEEVLVGFQLVAGGPERWSILHARATRLPDGRAVAVNTFHDVTPRIERERRIRASEQHMREQAEARRRDEEIARLLADTAFRLDEARDVVAIAQLAAEASIPSLGDWCVVDLIQPDGALKRVAIAAGDAELRARVEPLRDHPSVEHPDRVSRRAVATREAIVVPDVEEFWATEGRPDPDLRRILERTGVRSVVAQPLIARGEIMGSIVFATVGDRRHQPAETAAAAAMANRIGVAIANTVSYDAEMRARQAAESLANRMERLQAVTRVLGEVSTIEDVAAILLEEARLAFAADAAGVALVATDGGLEFLAGDRPGGAGTAARVPLDSDLPIARAIAENRPIWSTEPTSTEPTTVAGIEPTRGAGAGRKRPQARGRDVDAASAGSAVDDAAGAAETTDCAIPLVADQAPIGGLWLGFRQPRPIEADERRMILAYADLAAGAIVRLRLGSLRQELLAANESERARLESVLHRMPVGVILAAAPDGRFLYANDAARRQSRMPIVSGRSPAYDRARGYRPDGSELALDEWPLRRALAGETVENEIVEIVQADGSRMTYGISSAPIPGPSGAIEAAVVTYADVTDRIRAQERETFLARASGVLASSLDYEKTVQAVADLAVPTFADWCVVHVTGEEGLPQRIAVAHRDPEKVALAIRIQEEYPADPNAETGTAAVIRSGRSEFVANIEPAVIDASARDEHHRAMLRQLAPRHYISVPLIAGGRIIGALSLAGEDPDRPFEPDDVAFAENLATRAAAAIENARLFRDGVRFKHLLDATGDAVLMIEPEDGRIAYANRGAADQLGRPVEALVGARFVESLDEVGRAAVDAAIADLASGAAETRTESVTIRRPNRADVPVEIRLEAVAADGSPARILAIARDIRDRIEAQENLQALAAAEHARAAELNGVITAMGDGVVVCDRDGRIVLANPAAQDVFPDVDERTYAEILAQLEDPLDVAPRLGQRGGPVELRVLAGDERWIELSTWPVGPDQGDAGRSPHEETIVLLRDVTEQRQRQIVRDTFIGVLSHELRTPVTTIYAGAKVLARPGDLPADTRREIFDDIVLEAERLHRLVEDVVAMTRFQDEGGDVGAEPVLLQRLLPSVVASERARWPGVEFEVDVQAGLPTVTADPTYVEQVVRNLLSNAAKYSGMGSTVLARVAADDGGVAVRILDDGPGFPDEEAERLFDLFFRSAGTARSAAGAGIGLFVCARLIRAMGGRIWARNRPEGGAEFGFSLRVMSEND